MNHALAHQIYAGADLFLMPSMFEPCGLSQMIALRYGTLPVVRETGGLRDTVLAYNESTGEGNGFTFLNYNAHDMLHVIEQAVAMYRDKRDTFDRIARRAMRGLYGWDQSALKYIELYRKLAGKAAETAVAEAAVEAPAAEASADASISAPKKRAPRRKAADGEAAPAKPRAKKATTCETAAQPRTRKKKAEEPVGE